jgi:flagellar hook-basal body complex protein FliE
MNMKKKVFSMLALLAVATTGAWAQEPDPINLTSTDGETWTLASMPDYDVELEVEYYATTPFDLTVGESLHGTVQFTVGSEVATQACYDDVVTVTVTPDEGYSAKDVTVRAYTSWESAARRRAPSLVDDITVTKQQDGTWTFTMPEANVLVVVSYTKNLQDAWIEAIADVTYTGQALTPAITVKDGETTLTLNTDYTVAYADNTAAGTATVTVTGTGNYSGTASATFNIQKADITMTTAPAAVANLVYSGSPQTLITAGVASFGTVLYSLDGETYAEALPQGTDAGTYTVYYKVEGDDNHNAFAAQTVNVTIATNKTELNTAITDAEAYYNSISETNPDAAATLLTAINTAKDVQGNADATQTEIETAAQTLNEAVDAAKADVALKRVTIVIPAKSYVARVDADKRQIENAVAGVSLYTVQNVTNSEVVLTSALNVVAAGMPYLIYNDNNEEKTISIVVSAEDADAVQYDSEHFKGTLEAKTFTNEDMAAADHYVLSNGHDFVWVKDAGTLAAGKCWIELTQSTNNARALSIVFDGETTGISAVKTAATIEGNCYDLSGRKVAKPTKGLYIVNGKKIVVK